MITFDFIYKIFQIQKLHLKKETQNSQARAKQGYRALKVLNMRKGKKSDIIEILQHAGIKPPLTLYRGYKSPVLASAPYP